MKTPQSAVGNPRGAPELDPGSKEAFWLVVADCLEEFHHYPQRKARDSAASLRDRIESPPEGIQGGMIYHDEPFYVACDLAEEHDPATQDRLLRRFREKYQSILALRNW